MKGIIAKKKVRVNGVVMPLMFNGENIVVVLDPAVKGADQRKSYSKHEEHTKIDFVTAVIPGVTRPKRRRIKQSPFKTQLITS
jgi:hypothetical protein